MRTIPLIAGLLLSVSMAPAPTQERTPAPEGAEAYIQSVSYTHLTLPTIYSV